MIDKTTLDNFIGLTKQLDSLINFKNTKNYNVPKLPQKVEYREASDPIIVNFASRIGMNSREVQLIMADLLSNPSDQELEILKELLLIAKLGHEQPSIQFQDERRLAELNYENSVARVKKFNEDVINLDENIKQVKANMSELDEYFSNVVDQLKSMAESVVYVFDDLPSDSKEIFECIKKHTKLMLFVNDIDFSRKIIIAQWDKFNNFNWNHKTQILRSLSQL